MNSGPGIRVLIVETVPAWRDAFRSFCQSTGDIVVETIVSSARAAMKLTARASIDVVVLDNAVADLPPVDFTTQLLECNPETGIILTVPENDPVAAVKAVEALSAGAFDYALKPSLHGADALAVLERRMVPKIRAFSIRRYSRQARIAASVNECRPFADPSNNAIGRCKAYAAIGGQPSASRKNVEAILIGVSTGGPEALLRVVPLFPADFPLPVVIVLHMPKLFTGAMAGALGRVSRIPVVEAVDGQELRPGNVYLAPGGDHLELYRETRNRLLVRTTDAPPENGCRPSVDVLFRSAAAVLNDRVIAVVLTGMGCDGEQGAALLRAQGAFIITQDEATSVVWGMPGSIVRSGNADAVLPLDAIVPEVVGRVA